MHLSLAARCLTQLRWDGTQHSMQDGHSEVSGLLPPKLLAPSKTDTQTPSTGGSNAKSRCVCVSVSESAVSKTVVFGTWSLSTQGHLDVVQ